MTFKKGASGIESKGKTKGKNLGDSGPTAKIQNGGKKSAGVTGKLCGLLDAIWHVRITKEVVNHG